MRDRHVTDGNLYPPLTLSASAIPKRRLLRVKDAAVYMGSSPWKLRQLVQQGKLPVVQDVEGSPFLFDVRDLDGYIERSKRTTPL